MLETQNQSNPLSRSKLIGRYIVSCIFVFLTHLALSLIPRFFSVFSFLTQLVPFYISVNRPGFWFMRLRYCKTCKAYVKALDHHCPAFGTFIGQNNHPLFLILLLGFITTEASYLVCSLLSKSGILDRLSLEVVFVLWHIYCVCANIRTDEWINWKKYPWFQLVIPPQTGKYTLQHPFWICVVLTIFLLGTISEFFFCRLRQSFTNIRFRSPYDQGIVQNVKEFLALRT